MRLSFSQQIKLCVSRATCSRKQDTEKQRETDPEAPCLSLYHPDGKSIRAAYWLFVVITADRQYLLLQSRWRRRRRQQQWQLSTRRSQSWRSSIVTWQWRDWSSRKCWYRASCYSAWAEISSTWRCWRGVPWSLRPTVTWRRSHDRQTTEDGPRYSWRRSQSTTSCTLSLLWRWRWTTTLASAAAPRTSTTDYRSADRSQTLPATPASGLLSRLPLSDTSASVIP